MNITTLKEEIKQNLQQIIMKSYSIKGVEIEVSRNKKEGYGDYTSTVAFSLRKILTKKKPIEIGKVIEEEWKNINAKGRIEVAHPGFINIYLPEGWKISFLKEFQNLNFYDDLNSCKFIEALNPHDILLKREIEYIKYRTNWVLEVFKQEGTSPMPQRLHVHHIQYPIEEAILDQLLDWTDLVEDEEENNTKKMELLKEMVETFFKYHNSLNLRKLQDPHRNLVLNIFKAVNGVMRNYRVE